ncbi:MAG TPA: hypothetical protein VMA13_04800, partial [Candidatus Saccharimonadales bacterium]|nr:hypothetical protein [Candidatus Saccharimonadales bacterium]
LLKCAKNEIRKAVGFSELQDTRGIVTRVRFQVLGDYSFAFKRAPRDYLSAARTASYSKFVNALRLFCHECVDPRLSKYRMTP